MEILKDFGVDPFLLVAQIVNFLIILYVLRRFLYKPVFEMLKKREDTIKSGLEKSEEAQRILEQTLEEEKTILKRAQSQSNKLIEDAKNQAQEILKQSEENSKKQAQSLIKDAQEQIHKETKNAQEQLTHHVSELAVQFLQKAVQDLFGDKEQEEILAKAIKKIKQKPN